MVVTVYIVYMIVLVYINVKKNVMPINLIKLYKKRVYNIYLIFLTNFLKYYLALLMRCCVQLLLLQIRTPLKSLIWSDVL